MLSYPAAVDLSSRTLRYAAGLLRRHRQVIGSRWRKLGCGRQALLVLAHLRCGDTYTRLAAGFGVGVGVATVYRYVTELVDLLARHAPDLAAAVQTAGRKAYVVLDGTLIAIDRVGMRTKSDRPYYSGKHKRHGVNVQVLTDPAGRLIWASPALPGSVHDVKAARRHGLVHALTGYDIPVLADRGYQGARGTVRVPFRGRELAAGPAAVNTAHARLRARHAATRRLKTRSVETSRRFPCWVFGGVTAGAAVLSYGVWMIPDRGASDEGVCGRCDWSDWKAAGAASGCGGS